MVASTRPTRTPAKPAAATAVRRTARTPAKTARAASPTPTADALAGEMDRILKISKANPAPAPKPRVTKNAEASSSKLVEKREEKPKAAARAKIAPASTSTKATRTAGVEADVAPKAAIKPRTVKTTTLTRKPAESTSFGKANKKLSKPSTSSRLQGTSSKSSPSKPSSALHPAKAKSSSDLPDWAREDASSTMSISERANAIMLSINRHMKDLGAAVKDGYRHKDAGKEKSSSASRPEKSVEVPGEWSERRVEKMLHEAELGIQVLRTMEAGGAKMSLVDVERAGQALSLKMISFGMWTRAMKFQVEARSSILKLYPHSAPLDPAAAKGKAKAVLPSAKSAVAPSISHSKSMAASAKPKAPSDLPREWTAALSFPPASNLAAMSEAITTVIFQSCASAWICVLNLGDLYNVDLSAVLAMPTSHAPGPSTRLHPVVLACSLPRLTSVGLINHIYRALYHHSSLFDPHLRQLLWTILAVYVSTTPNDPSPSSPTVLWGAIQRYAAARLVKNASKTDMDELHTLLKQTLDWTEYVIDVRKESREAWFSGDAWRELEELWINLARKVRDETTVQRLLGIKSPARPVSIVPSTPPSKPSLPSATPTAVRVSLAAPSPMRPSFPSRHSSRTRKRIQDAEAAISRATGELASILIVLEKHIASPSDEPLIASAESTLLASNLVHLSDALLSLGKDSDDEVVKRSFRAVERVRRSAVKIHDAAPKECKGALGSAAEKWIVGYLDLVEDQLEESPIIPDSSAYDLASGAVDCVLCLLRPGNGTETHESALLDRGRRLCDLAKMRMTVLEGAYLLRCLMASAYNIAIKYWRAEDWSTAHKFSFLCSSWSAEALSSLENLPEDQEAAAAKITANIREPLAKRYEFVACILQKLGDKEGAIKNLITSLAVQSPKVVAVLRAVSPTASLTPIFAPSGQLVDVGSTVARLTSIVISDCLYPEKFAYKVHEACQKAKLPDFAAGLILESLFVSLEDGQHKTEVANIMLEVGDVVLEYYNGEEQEARKLRMLTRMLNLFVITGTGLDRFDATSTEAESVASALFATDAASANFAREYRATILVLRALRSYHTQSQSAASVVRSANAALDDLRSLIIPASMPPVSPKRESGALRPTKQLVVPNAIAIPRTPARRSSDAKRPKLTSTPSSSRRHVSEQAKPRSSLPVSVYDDLPRLVRLLGGLTSLLGMLGHAFARIDCLKTLRALLRNQSSMADDYVKRSGELASEYAKLGKQSRAASVFAQAITLVKEDTGVTGSAKTVLHLRYSAYLAEAGKVDEAVAEYNAAEELEKDWKAMTVGRMAERTVERCDQIHRSYLARKAMIAINEARGGVQFLEHHEAIYQLWWKISDNVSRLASSQATSAPPEDDDPFAIPDEPKLTGQDEPAKDAVKSSSGPADNFKEKRLFCLQWYAAEGLFNATMELVTAYAARGSVKDAEYYLDQGCVLAQTVKSAKLSGRVNAQWALLDARMRKFDSSSKKLEDASAGLEEQGPEAIELRRIQGDIFFRNDRMQEAVDAFDTTEKDLLHLDGDFINLDARLPTPRKVSAFTGSKETLLPSALRHVVRQQAWLARQAGNKDTVDSLLSRLQALGGTADSRAEELYLRGRLQLFSASEQFKMDLFMSSLTESTIAMPMNIPVIAPRDRASARLGIAALLQRADASFRDALELFNGSGAVEDVRQARLNLALLHAFQTSLQKGSSALTGAAANLLASNSSITLQRELMQVINDKFKSTKGDSLAWPSLSASSTAETIDEGLTDEEREKQEMLQSFWRDVQSRHTASFLPSEAEYDLSALPSHWAVISINVTDDHNTMFISRHQRDHEPLVFCLPLDRQGRREGEDEEDLFTFDVAVAEMKSIIASSDENSRTGKHKKTWEEIQGWWDTRRDLDRRMQELLLNIEYVWLGPFKTILSSRGSRKNGSTDAFREKMQKIFVAALADAGGDSKKATAVTIPEPLMECFATLSNKCKDEEVEDLIYFILDIYQFHGVPVAIAELDIDQMGVDVRGALLETEPKTSTSPVDEEHIFLVLDRNVAEFPWESIPSLRGRPSSRIPSLPFLLDQLTMSRQLQALGPALAPAPPKAPRRNGMKRTDNLSSALSRLSLNPSARTAEGDFRHVVNARKVFYILNPSGDLSNTQTHFEGWLTQMADSAGWKGIIGRSPTELELSKAYQDHELVLYFGHGGAEQYIRSHKIKTMTSCATTMLWGCSSGVLADQGDLDRNGTPWNYMMAGCPSLVANLWDVTDRDIDRLSEAILQRLHLDISHVSSNGPSVLPVSELSVVQAVNRSRDDCKFHYLTGAAPVVYGLPAYFH